MLYKLFLLHSVGVEIHSQQVNITVSIHKQAPLYTVFKKISVHNGRIVSNPFFLIETCVQFQPHSRDKLSCTSAKANGKA